MSGAPPNGERDYRATIAEMRVELVDVLKDDLDELQRRRETGAWRDGKWYQHYRSSARMWIRRIRALDAVVAEAKSGAGEERARIAYYLHRLGDYGMRDLAERIMRGEHEMAAQEPRR